MLDQISFDLTFRHSLSLTAAACTAQGRGLASRPCTVRAEHSVARAAPGHKMICCCGPTPQDIEDDLKDERTPFQMTPCLMTFHGYRETFFFMSMLQPAAEIVPLPVAPCACAVQ